MHEKPSIKRIKIKKMMKEPLPQPHSPIPYPIIEPPFAG
jgi:hypothetical protein